MDAVLAEVEHLSNLYSKGFINSIQYFYYGSMTLESSKIRHSPVDNLNLNRPSEHLATGLVGESDAIRKPIGMAFRTPFHPVCKHTYSTKIGKEMKVMRSPDTEQSSADELCCLSSSTKSFGYTQL
jgi:hypothetical protein